jgi:hypothetical protein
MRLFRIRPLVLALAVSAQQLDFPVNLRQGVVAGEVS